jgi:hypothetical protein
VGGELSTDEQIGEERSFATQEAASSEEQNVAGELSTDEQIGEERSFATHEAASSEEQNVAGELSADEQIGEEHSFAIQEAASSEEQNVAGELSADEQIQAHSFATLRSSLVRRAEECRKRKRQKRCCRPRDGEDPRAADWDRHQLR